MTYSIRRWVVATILGCLFLGSVKPVAAQQAETARKRTSGNLPVYPQLARNLRLEGSVKLRVVVAPNGAAKSSEVLGGNAVFSKAAQEAVASWKWAPAQQESQELVFLNFHP